MKLKPDKGEYTWRTHIVKSSSESARLPSNLKDDGVDLLCDVISVLDSRSIDMKLKNGHWYNFKSKYIRARFDVKVILGAADIKFQLLTKDRKVISRDHDIIKVQWEPPKPTATETVVNEVAMYKATD